METSWYGLFDLAPDDTLEVRAGDLQAFLRQQMMGVTNPGLTVEVKTGEHDRMSDLDKRVSESLRDPARDRQLQRLRREAGWRMPDMAEALGIPLSQYLAYERGERPIPPDVARGIAERLGAAASAVPKSRSDMQEETFCDIRWMRDDVLAAIKHACGVELDRGGTDADEVEAIIDVVIDEVRKQLQDRSIEEGWDIIDTLMPDSAIERAEAVAKRVAARSEARTNVIKALDEAGWKVHGNDAGDMFTLTYINPRTDREFCVVLDMRGRDMADALAWSEAARLAIADEGVLWRGGLRKDEMNYVKADIDRFKAEVRRYLPDVIGHAFVATSSPSGGEHVRDWYVRAFSNDELGDHIVPSLTFDDALRAVSLGSGFYDALGVGDSVVRGRVFQELADRNGVSYDDIYDAWLHETPVNVAPAPSSELAQGGVSLSEEAALSKQASEQLSGNGHTGHDMQDRPSISDELR